MGQRAATAVSCFFLWLLLYYGYTSLDTWSAKAALVLLSLLACVEKLSSVVNTISVERDWVRKRPFEWLVVILLMPMKGCCHLAKERR